ncbi:geranylgeranylglyceryl/heptaprenylglyceryl phosphate synthase [Psychroflexus tropicus]|uniref:geranylgeranylglyceryl/heptaprenylglyceryl phosphate synthase n=1 Tax=Psychroflexus tropicus TaxID=197345 RepID=UPI00036DD990|nr:geranylgeranylglyceryl/heptaprenylglyceryl phosphate synthase [Psychroflexus tropicus]
MIKTNRNLVYKSILEAVQNQDKLLSVLIDPDKFETTITMNFLENLPYSTRFLFVGGSKVNDGKTDVVVRELKKRTHLPIVLFPGDVNQITDEADCLLFLSLLSGRNPEYLIDQQVKSITKLQFSPLEIIPTGYILIDGGSVTSVLEISQTKAIPQHELSKIIHTALAGQFSGKQLIYLEAGSGAKHPVSPEIISAVKDSISVPLIVGGGIKTEHQRESAFKAGADMVVMGNAFERSM